LRGRISPHPGPSPRPDRSDTAGRFTYRISLDHRFSEEVLGYISYSTGFKSGGYNSGVPTAAPFKPEDLKAGEVGLKTDLFNRRLRLNVAGFYYDYKNIQVQKIALFALFLSNGAAARDYGLDADFTAVLSDSFTLTGGFTWLNPKFTSFPGCPVSTPQGGVPLNPNGNCGGNQLPFAAKFSSSVAANYTVPMGNGKLGASANVYTNSGYGFEPDDVTRQDSYAKVGASLKWTSDRNFSVGAYGTNLTNRRTMSLAATQAGGNVGVLWADPRIYGVRLGYKF
jgi:iron complex outermembrane receptor protein